ncbi:MAG: hypothetical protein A2151_04045 [Candidatus Muproteobacteria bacterium RBG_16_65_34]|uniref:Protein SirB1 N-terminal domain-containing protein n=1 Tax=Candidatus Muproteobacteria bacterium RBG_16_65_34 TaxID=1817760 RepID=A0A1F6TTH9_9PROT|nr:MAG: hypothetical protein A2151_04045 [Candidatus Muproteobacteria bacterium RBG_16_65_34]
MEAITLARLRKIAGRSEQELDLAEAALLIAAEEYPDLDVAGYLRRLDELAEGLRGKLPEKPDLEHAVAALNRFMFEEQGFSGDTENYYDPRNSFLNEVLDRRRGVPITLSIIYMEIGWRLGLPLEGVSFPGHFLVKLATAEGDVVLDPFHGGVPLSEEDLRERLDETYSDLRGLNAPLERLLAASGKKEILVRMLRNLKLIYLREQEPTKALTVLDRILVVRPDLPEELRDRAQVYERLECYRAAAEDYQRYLALAPTADDAQDIHGHLVELRRVVSRMN